MIHYDKCIKHGHEGTVVKNMNAVWQPKRTKDCGKCKAEEDCSLKVVNIIEGSGKYSGMLGAFECSDDNNTLQVNVGSGFSDEERRQFYDKKYIGSYIDVLYNQIIFDKKTGIKSLFLPRYLKLRLDKHCSDSF
jgi:DNA ligase-1